MLLLALGCQRPDPEQEHKPRCLNSTVYTFVGNRTCSHSLLQVHPELGSPVVPFYPFSFWVPLLKPNSRKKDTLIVKGLLGNLAK